MESSTLPSQSAASLSLMPSTCEPSWAMTEVRADPAAGYLGRDRLKAGLRIGPNSCGRANDRRWPHRVSVDRSATETLWRRWRRARSTTAAYPPVMRTPRETFGLEGTGRSWTQVLLDVVSGTLVLTGIAVIVGSAPSGDVIAVWIGSGMILIAAGCWGANILLAVRAARREPRKQSR